MNNENRLVEANIGYVAIPIDEYKDLLAIRERTTVAVEYINNAEYPKEEMIQIILGYNPPKEVR